ncbi:MAG: DJ-1 family glyoxalase III [Chitinispirillaceae bacterium]
MASVITVLADGFEEVEAVTCIDLLRRAHVDVTVLGLDSLEIRGAHNIRIRADLQFKDFSDQFDALVLPGGMPGTNNLASSEMLIEMIKRAHSQGKICAAICAAPTVLARAGILTGKKVACYPGFEDRLMGGEPVKEPVVVDDTIITSRGVGTAIPFSLKLISTLKDKETAATVSSAILHSPE